MVMRYLGGVNSPSYNPLAANVTTGTTVVQDGGVYTVASAAQANGNTQWINDPFFSSDTILLQADNFANGAQNNTFLDSSQNNFTVTRNGNTTQGSFNPVATPNGYWSNYFHGASATYLATPSTSALSFGTGNFSFEVFGFAASWPAVWRFITTPTPFSINGDTTSGLVKLDLGAGGVSTGITLPINTWFHFAVTRQSGTVRAFLNGVLLYTVANSTNFSATGITYIGGIAGFSQAWSGYLSNLRVVNGNVPTAYQTSSTTLNTVIFTPPIEPLTTTSQGAPGTNTVLTCQSNRFIDNGTSPIAITPTNAVSVIPSSPFRTSGPGQYPAIQWGASMSFNGSTNWLSLANSTPLTVPVSTSFTLECWVYLTTAQANYRMIVGDTDSYFAINAAGIEFQFGGNFSATISSCTFTFPVNTWVHIAVVRVTNTVSIYINGVSQTVTNPTQSVKLFGWGATLYIGRWDQATPYPWVGNISNLRLVNGTALYTANFTPPTQPLTAVTNTQLLTCQGSAVDSSTNNFTITNNNSVTASTSGPFAIPGSTGSMYFDGTGDTVTVPDSNAFTLSTNNFTLELWVYPISNGNILNIVGQSDVGGGATTQSAVIYRNASNILVGYANSGTTQYACTSTDTVVSGSWYHIALVRNGTTLALYINGRANGTASIGSASVNNATSVFAVGNVGAIVTSYYSGYVSNVRLVNGTAVYTAAFTPPTAPLTAISGTQLLLNGTNAGIYDASARTAAETVGNAQVTTAIKKYGSGSMAFDGTGDWLLVPNSSDLNFGTGDFTVECWLNMTNTTTTRHLIGKGTATTGWAIYFNAAPTLFIFEYAGSISYSSNYNLNTNQWYHLAIVRSGLGSNNFKMFINGFLIHEATITNNLTTTSNMYVGASRTATNSMFGYIDDLRISKFARYTGPFIPPAVAMQDQG